MLHVYQQQLHHQLEIIQQFTSLSVTMSAPMSRSLLHRTAASTSSRSLTRTTTTTTTIARSLHNIPSLRSNLSQPILTRTHQPIKDCACPLCASKKLQFPSQARRYWSPEDPKPQVFKSPEHISERVIQLVQSFDKFQGAEQVPHITPTSTFQQLQLDSLDEVELMVHIERHLSVEIPDDVAQHFKGLGDIVQWIQQHPKVHI